jgi:hypothetical protein
MLTKEVHLNLGWTLMKIRHGVKGIWDFYHGTKVGVCSPKAWSDHYGEGKEGGFLSNVNIQSKTTFT